MRRLTTITSILMSSVMVLMLAGCGTSSSSSTSTEGTSNQSDIEVGSASTIVDTAASGSDSSEKVSTEYSSNSSNDSTDIVIPDELKEGDPLTFDYFNLTMEVEWIQQIYDALQTLGKEYNFTVLNSDANYNIETQQSQVDTALTQGLDGAFLFVVDEGSATSVVDKFDEAGVPVIGETLKLQDGEGNNVAPYVELAAEKVGGQCGEWVAENWQSTNVDLSDASTTGIIINYNSTFQSDVNRGNGFEEAIKEGLPDIPEENYFIADNASEANSDDAENSYNTVSATIAANPQIANWVIIGTVDHYARGACRAVEQAGVQDNTIIVSCGGELAVGDWDTGSSPEWYAACYYSAMDFAEYMVLGMLQVKRGGMTTEEIYPEFKEDGQKYAAVEITGQMITPDNYKEIVQ